MELSNATFARTLIAAGMLLVLPDSAAIADDGLGLLKREVNELRKELAEVKAELKQQRKQAASKDEVSVVENKVARVERQHSDWKDTNSTLHVAGYADIGYADAQNSTGSFNQARFNPIFHFLYKDLLLLEAEAETGISSTGSTEFNLEYATMDLFLTDNITVFGGKFLSPMGYFRQNLHPSWINKFPSAPIGFGHDGAAPEAGVGAGVRGGFGVGARSQLNYALYIGNGPELASDGSELDGVKSGGFTRDADGKKVIGGRLGIVPIPHLEFGVSAGGGKTSVTKDEGSGTAIVGDAARDYTVLGADFAYQRKQLDLRGEYIQQKVGDASASVAPRGGTWKTWYVQAAYRLLPTKWEGVLRYGDFDSPHDVQDQQQWGVGMNYLFGPNLIAKIGYEFNQGQSGTVADDNRLLLQLSYGF